VERPAFENCGRISGVTRIMTPSTIPTASKVNESSDTLMDRDTRELLVGNTIGVCSHQRLAFEPSQYVTIQKLVQASNLSHRTANCPQASLHEKF
jgi:hypothetical protein